MDESLSLSGKETTINIFQKMGVAAATIASILLVTSNFNLFAGMHQTGFWALLLLYMAAVGFYSYGTYAGGSAGIKNDHNYFRSITSRGLWGWVLGVGLTTIYVLLYWYPHLLGFESEGANTGLVALFDPLSYWIKGQPSSQWFMYGAIYTLAILFLGIKFLIKYRHNRYHTIRTLSVIFFQLGFAFLIPAFLQAMNQPYYDFKNIWPLDYSAFFEWRIQELLSSGTLGLIMLSWSAALILVVTPILTYFYGKRWYCSWVCGCGGLAETAGDPFRHLSDKSTRAWKIERWIIHFVLVFVFVTTLAVLYQFFRGSDHWLFHNVSLSIFTTFIIIGFAIWYFVEPGRFKTLDPLARNLMGVIGAAIIVLSWEATLTGRSELFFIDGNQLRSQYGFLIGATFSGVIGVGFYPIMGNRVWCRFGCPMAAILGIQQKFFSKFRITTNGSQCISCGNCSTYCEMGIDVKAYAQKGQNIVRASCVGCGICSAVCPRGVLKLENGPNTTNKASVEKALHISKHKVSMKPLG